MILFYFYLAVSLWFIYFFIFLLCSKIYFSVCTKPQAVVQDGFGEIQTL